MTESETTTPTSNMVTIYFQKIWSLLSEPSEFCRNFGRIRTGMTEPLVFALISHWIGALIAFAWSGTMNIAIGSRINSWFSQLERTFSEQFGSGQIESLGRYAGGGSQLVDLFSNWMYGVATVLVDPFLTILKIFLYAAFIFVGSKLLVGSHGRFGKPDFEAAVRVVCYATAISILAAIPLAGGVIAFLYGTVVAVIAAREIYGVDTGRAIVVGLFPQIVALLFFLLIGILSVFLVVFAFM